MEYRRLGRLGHASSVLIYGAASLGAVTQDVADASIEFALASGINHIDTAASYGDSEERLGATLPSWRDRVFLATKVEERDYEAAWASINRSLERLRTDRLDLLQLHNVSSWEILDRVTAPDGALRAAIRAREEGLTAGLGITGHTHDAPRIHLEGLRRFDFDTVLTPLNERLWRVEGFADAFRALAAEVRAGDRGLMTIKAIARRPWPEGERRYATWYEPFDEQDAITAAVSWVLDGHPEVTGIATAGETRLLERIVRAEAQRIDVAAAEDRLAGLAETEYASVFAD
nr:aldo/keto reductase [Propionibacterium sp.]